MASRIHFQYGPFVFSSGYVPQAVKGPDRDAHVVEHQIPAAEGGIVEYVGSKQPTYQLRGFLTASNDQFAGPAAAVLSGTGYVALNADDARAYLLNLRVSGPQLLRIESTASNMSGYRILYENGFFYIKKSIFAYEAAHTYPYYPYSFEMQGASIVTYGNNSGTLDFTGDSGKYFSGYIRAWIQRSGLPNGEMVIAIGLYAQEVASGNAKVAIYNSGNTLQAQSANQPVNSGWNYFPLQPSFVTTSGAAYTFALKSDVANTSGWHPFKVDAISPNSGSNSYQSGITYSGDFPTTFAPGTLANVSSINFDMTMIT